MNTFRLSLADTVQKVMPPVLKLYVDNEGVAYDLYRSTDAFQGEKPTTWEFERIAENCTNSLFIFEGETLLFYFFLAIKSSENPSEKIYLPHASVANSEVLQARTDTEVVIVIDDIVDVVGSNSNYTLIGVAESGRSNIDNCATFNLPAVTNEVVYVVAYETPNSNYHLLQAAICTKNDERFPIIIMPKYGMKLFSNSDKDEPSLTAGNVPLKVYKLKLEDVPESWQPLFPYYFS